MIGSFWNFCRACPSVPLDKVHSEYRSTYKWHEYTGAHQEKVIVKQAPLGLPKPSLEPALPRRKKCPEIAYKKNTFITDYATNNIAERIKDVSTILPSKKLSRAISRISTEYRLQFCWPLNQKSSDVHKRGVTGRNFDECLKNMYMTKKLPDADIAPVHAKHYSKLQEGSKRGVSNKREDEAKRGNAGVEEDRTDLGTTALRNDEHGPGKENKKGEILLDNDIKELRHELRKLAQLYKNRDWASRMVITDNPERQPSGDLIVPRSRSRGREIGTAARKSATNNVDDSQSSNAIDSDTKTNSENEPSQMSPTKFDMKKQLLMRHHLDRTTNGSSDGTLILSPTREKLEPITPYICDKSRDQKEIVRRKRSVSRKRSANLKERNVTDKEHENKNVRINAINGANKLDDTKNYDSGKGTINLSEIDIEIPRDVDPKNLGDISSSDEKENFAVTAKKNQADKTIKSYVPPEYDDVIIKSPPEPTRVKSPELIIMHSPEPVNWTVPLDTAKTFTVTQNVYNDSK